MKKLLIAIAAAALAVPAAQGAQDRVGSTDDRSSARATSPRLLPQGPDAAAPPTGAYVIQAEAERCSSPFCRAGVEYLSLDATTALGGSGVAAYTRLGIGGQTSATIALDCVAVHGSTVWATGKTATGSSYSISIRPGVYGSLGPEFNVRSGLGDGPCDSAADAWEAIIQTGFLEVVLAGKNTPPQASFTSSCSGLTCTFDGRGSSDADAPLTDFRWLFGGGSRASGRVVSHTYASQGTYWVELMVRDNAGAIDSVTRQVTVG